MSAAEDLGLRRATPDDAQQLHELVAAAGRALAEQGFTNWLSPTTTERFVEDIRTREVYLVVADDTKNRIGVRPQLENSNWGQTPNGGPIATFTVGETARRPYSAAPWLDPAATALYLNRLAVHPALQGGGIGGWCLEQVERLARERGARAVRCDVLTANTRLCRLYERFGYQARGERSHSGWDFTCYERVID
jgi:ribosomal protein S18 acetylase RimI-like enzyme